MILKITTAAEGIKLRNFWVNPDVSVPEIAKSFGCSPNLVRVRARELKLGGRPKLSRPPSRPGYLIHDTPEFRDDWSGDLTLGEIAEKYNATSTTVSNAAKRFGLGSRVDRRFRKTPPQQPKAERILRAVETTEEEEIPRVHIAHTDFWTVERDTQVVMTKGKYSKIARLADDLGVLSSHVNARWLKLRVVA